MFTWWPRSRVSGRTEHVKSELLLQQHGCRWHHVSLPAGNRVEPELVGLGRVRGLGQLSLGRGRERGAGGAQGRG